MTRLFDVGAVVPNKCCGLVQLVRGEHTRRYGSGREGYGGSLTVRARPGRPEDDYEADDWDGSYGGRGDYGRKRGRRESPPPSRSRRHRY